MDTHFGRSSPPTGHEPFRRRTRPFEVVVLALCACGFGGGLLGAQERQSPESLQDRVEELTRETEQAWAEIVELFESFSVAEGEERLIIDAQVRRRAESWWPLLEEQIQSVVALEAAGGEAPEARASAVAWLAEARRLVRDELQDVEDRLTALRVRRSGMERADMLPVEREIAQISADLDRLLRALYRFGDLRESLGLDAETDWAYLDPLLIARAERLVGEIELSQADLDALAERLESASGDEERIVRAEITATRERLTAGTTGLSAVVEILDERDLDAVEYKQLLIQATGQVTTDVFDLDVAAGLLRDGWRSAVAWTMSRAPQLLINLTVFLVILAVFKLLAWITGRVVSAAIGRANPNVPVLLKSVGVSIISNAVFLLGILIGLSQLGIHVGPLLAGLGVAGFIMGFALQDTLSNFASGLMILVYRPFDVGDVVEAGGVGGKVANMSLVSTTILTFDNQKLIVPNREIWGNVIRNKTAEDTRRVDLTVAVGDRADVARAVEILQNLLDAHPLVLDDPAPAIKVNALGESSTELIVRPWVKTENYWTVYWDVTRMMNDELEQAGISRPFHRSEMRIAGSPPADWATANPSSASEGGP